MIVEVVINGVTVYRWPVNENEGIPGAYSWQNKVKFREYSVKRIPDQIKREVLPNLKDRGHIEIYTVFTSRFEDDVLANAKNTPKPVRLMAPPQKAPKPEPIKRPIPKEKEPFQRPRAEYDNKQFNKILDEWE